MALHCGLAKLSSRNQLWSKSFEVLVGRSSPIVTGSDNISSYNAVHEISMEERLIYYLIPILDFDNCWLGLQHKEIVNMPIIGSNYN